MCIRDRIKSGTFTVFHNGILVLNNVQILGTTEFRGYPKLGRDEISGYMPGKSLKKNIYIQDHEKIVMEKFYLQF